MKRVRCPKCENFLTFDETKYTEGQSLVFICDHCKKQFSIRLGKSKVQAPRKEEKLDENEFQNAFGSAFTQHGLSLSGTSPNGQIVEAIELPELDFFVGVQFHPEFKSRPNRPHPLFLGLVGAALHAQERTARR